MGKKFYWLKIQEHFFDSDEMIYFESMENGDRYIVIWLKILLKCLKDKENEEYGFLRFNDKLPYNDELLAKVLRCDLDTLRVAMKFFQDLNMIQILDDKTIYIESVQRMIGKESDSAERMRVHRAKKKLIEDKKVKKIESAQSDKVCVTSDPNKEVEVNKDIDKEVEKQKLAFNHFWKIYDYKSGKQKAEKAFNKIKPDIYPIIFKHAKDYILSTPDKQFRKLPATYLNNECWNDEIIKRVDSWKTEKVQEPVITPMEKL